ncbi:hypothetical protein C2845_PM02G17380 [Panicum miliaceum]|uniref:Uncharacterized protein n=1 Tax=Panicum miliaceum TaxID=4540 RepID=A0A3L6S5Q0_PANMI|nr:hypothetical protein C2845_PM02G17380 [Panicum miliaceum]
MATRAPETVGFPALLNEILRRTHYTFRPEYAVYAHGHGVGMVDYVATLHLEARMVVGSEAYDFQARGTSPEMAIQEVAREAITRLHYEHRELWEDPFTYLPAKGPEEPFGRCVSPPVGPFTLERCMVETTSAYEWAHQSLLWELEETRRRLYNLQVRVELYTRMRGAKEGD